MAENTRTCVTILTGAYRIKGYIDLLPGARLTDYINEAKPFIAVTDAEVWESGDRRILSTAFVNVSRDHIVVITPEH